MGHYLLTTTHYLLLPIVTPRHILLLLASFLISLAPVLADGPTSKFTSTAEKDSVVLSKSGKDDEMDSFSMRCRGLGGYQLIHLGGDLRSWINVQYGKAVSDLYAETMKAGPGTFPSKTNDVVEWRGIERKGKFTPYAIIYRISGGNDETRKVRTRLLVIKLDHEHSTIVGHAEGKDEDAQAKVIADRYQPR